MGLPFYTGKRFRYCYDLFTILTTNEIKLRYKNTFLGFFWSLANPLLLALIFFFAFKIIMRIQIENYALFILSGLFPWQWFASSVNVSPNIFISNAPIIKKVKFPRWVLPLSTLGNNFFHFAMTIPVYLIFMFIYGKSPNLIWISVLPLLCVIQAFLILGIIYLVATLNVFFRDLEHITLIATSIVFYFTPILYPEEMLPLDYRWVIYVNPLSPLIINWHQLLINNTVNLELVVVAAGYSVLVFIIGFSVYRRLEWKFAEVI